ncbi:MAG TPA: hypothetical protein VII56_13140 [Rhizomicrobium sp.]
MPMPFLLNFAVSLDVPVEPPLPAYDPSIQGRKQADLMAIAEMGGTRNYTTKHDWFTNWEDWDG